MKEKIKLTFQGIIIGIVNGMFGAGGGMLAVPFLKKNGLSQKEAHIHSISVILPLCIISSVLYWMSGRIDIKATLPLLPFGLIGAFIGTKIMKKISDVWLRRIFAVFMLYAGIRMFLK